VVPPENESRRIIVREDAPLGVNQKERRAARLSGERWV